MYDIASSKYKQLCQIRKINSDNLEVTENEKPTEWEPKARRMMQWCLTDGVQNIAAIEYIPFKQMRVRFLHCNILYGKSVEFCYLILLQSFVQCQFYGYLAGYITSWLQGEDNRAG